MNIKLAVIRGDGIGPEIVDEAIKVLDLVGVKFGHKFTYDYVLAGGCSIDEYGVPLTDEVIEKCKAADSVLLGAVGGPKWESLPGNLRPERALLGLRGALGLFANIRPAKLHDALKEACPLNATIVKDGIDLVVLRELTGGLYYGERGRKNTDMGEAAFDTMIYSEYEVERIGRLGFEMARLRRNKVTNIDKANVLESSRLWREVMHRLKAEFPDVSYEDMLVDNAAMQLVRNPAQFDVIVTENMFGDILSDEASMVTGSIGMLPSASLGETRKGLYEPIHGSAPDIAGLGVANPIATILSLAMMFKYTFNLNEEADAIENAVKQVLDEGYRTGDIMSEGKTKVGTTEMGELIRKNIKK